MKPIEVTNYRCSQCGKIYDKYWKAEECCVDRDEIEREVKDKIDNIIKSMPPEIITTEDYVRTVLAINDLSGFQYGYRYSTVSKGLDIVRRKENECIEYLERIAGELLYEFKTELTKEVIVDGKKYIPFDIHGILGVYFADGDQQDYDLVCAVY